MSRPLSRSRALVHTRLLGKYPPPKKSRGPPAKRRRSSWLVTAIRSAVRVWYHFACDSVEALAPPIIGSLRTAGLEPENSNNRIARFPDVSV
jgi:hypothetical protein